MNKKFLTLSLLFILCILWPKASSGLTISNITIVGHKVTIYWDESGCGYNCQLVQNNPAQNDTEYYLEGYCSSPKTYENLSEGSYTFTVWDRTDPYSPTIRSFDVTPHLSINPSSQYVSKTGGTLTFEVTTPGPTTINWTAVFTSSWIKILTGGTGINDGTFTIEYEANSGAERVGRVEVSSPQATNSPQVIEVRQSNGLFASGFISEDTLWDAPKVEVFGDITVGDGVTLTIAPGTAIIFQGHYALNIKGRLLAEGEENSIIVFTAQPSHGWHGIRFTGTSEASEISKLIYCRLEGGKAIGDGNDADGGAIYFYGNSDLLVSHCTIVNNYAEKRGGGIYCCAPNTAQITFHDNTIAGNSAETGGGIYMINTYHLTFVNNAVQSNTAESQGGGFFAYNSLSMIINNLICSNTVSYGYGGGIYDYSSAMILVNNTICNNGAQFGGGGVCFQGSSSTISNTIIYGNINDQVYSKSSSSPVLTYCNVQGGYPGAGNINENPQFAGNGPHPYQLQSTSPCVNAGDPETTDLPDRDMMGNPRIIGVLVDIGAYERQSIAPELANLNDGLIDEDTQLTIELSATDEDGDPLVFLALSDDDNIEANIEGNRLTLTPAADWYGRANIIVTVSDGVLTVSKIFVLSVNPIDDPPELSKIDNLQIDEDRTVSIPLFATEVDGDEVIFFAQSDNEKVCVSMSGNSLTLVPAAHWYGQSNIIVTANDGKFTDSETFTLTVNPVNDAPVLASIGSHSMGSIAESTELTISLSATDVEGEPLTFTATSDNPGIAVSVNGSNLSLSMLDVWFMNAYITVTVSDGELTDGETFSLTQYANIDGRLMGTPNWDSSLPPFYDGDVNTRAQLDEVQNHSDFPYAYFGVDFNEMVYVRGLRFFSYPQAWGQNHINQFKVSALAPGLSPGIENNWIEIVSERSAGSRGWTEVEFMNGPLVADQIRVIYTGVSFGYAPDVGELQFLTSSRAPVPDLIPAFFAEPVEGPAPFIARFTNSSFSPSPTHIINSVQWDFGDGYISTEENPIHTYAEEGAYSITLTISDGSCWNTLFANEYIHVLPHVIGFTIHATATDGGQIYPSGDLLLSQDGGSQVFVITPDANYHVEDVKVDGVSIGPVATYTFTDIGEDHSIEALFTLTPSHFPFPQNIRYPFGIMPDDRDSKDARDSYITWKSIYVTTQGAGGFRRVLFDDLSSTASEGIGYGMLLAVNYNDKQLFDDLWSYYNLYLDKNGLMHWKIDASGDVIGQNAATDADQHVAFALVLADKQWENYSDNNYQQNAIDLINKIFTYEVEPETYILKPGDDWGGSDVTNPSYLMPMYYRVFKSLTGDSEWDLVAEKSYEILQNASHPTTGLVPDWCKADGTSVPCVQYPNNCGYDFSYNATRVPMHIAMDYIWFGAEEAHEFCRKVADFMGNEIGIQNIGDSYHLDGTSVGKSHESAFVGTIASASLATDSTFQSICNGFYNENLLTLGDSYYHATLRALTIFLQTGNFFYPQIKHTITSHANGCGTIEPLGPVKVDHRSDLIFNIIPDVGYYLENLSVDDTLIGGTATYAFTAVTRDHTINATFSPLIINLTSDTQNIVENEKMAIVSVSLNALSEYPVTIEYSIQNGTAIEDFDYMAAASNTITFEPGEIIKTITIPIIDDSDAEMDETVNFYLRDPENATLGPHNSIVLTIVDDDVNKDMDGDGFSTTEGDCNDKDSTIYPDAPEKCDGVDNDCDSQIDEECTFLCGDADGNGVVDIFDALLVAEYDAGLKAGEDLSDFSACDVDGNQTVDIFDALMIAEYDAGLVGSLRCGP